MASDSDSDAAPEALSLSQSKAGAKERNAAIHRAEAARIRQRKEQNKKRDEVFKKKAGETKKAVVHGNHKGKAKNVQNNEDEEERRLQDRMARAMMEAGEESDMSEGEVDLFEPDCAELEVSESSPSESDSGPSTFRHKVLTVDDNEGGLRGFDENFRNGIEADNGDGDEDEGVVDEYEEEEEELQRPRKKLRKSKMKPAEEDYLPDHLFTSALSKPFSLSRREKTIQNSNSIQSDAKRNKHRRKASSKDLIVGKKTIRTLPAKLVIPSMKAAARTVPPPKIRKFMDSSLSLKDSSKRKKLGWERRPVNIGNMRNNDLPATSFVRG